MPDILIRDVSAEVVAGIDVQARRMGLSRTEYLRRTLARETARGTTSVSVDDMVTVAELGSDLDDPAVMDDAWS